MLKTFVFLQRKRPKNPCCNLGAEDCLHSRQGRLSRRHLRRGRLLLRGTAAKYLGSHLKQPYIKLNENWRTPSSRANDRSSLILPNCVWSKKPNGRTHGVQLWGSAANSNIEEIVERFQAKALRVLTGALRFKRNKLIRDDLGIPSVRNEFGARIERDWRDSSSTRTKPPLLSSGSSKTKEAKRPRPLDSKIFFLANG